MILCDFLILGKKVFVDENCNLITTNNDLETIVGIWTGKPRKLYRIIIVHFMLSFIVYLSLYKGLNWFICIRKPVSSSSAKENYGLSFHFAGAAASSERGQLQPPPPSTPASTTIDILGE